MLLITEKAILVLGLFLLVHFIGVKKKLYYTTDWFDILTHFLAGITLSLFIKELLIAFSLMIAWEIIEVILYKPGKPEFKETLANKARDLAADIAGYALGLIYL